jgi:tetratricopeptide (TPR) repeat protein
MRVIIGQLQEAVGGHTVEFAVLLNSLASYERRLGEFDHSLANSNEAVRIFGSLVERTSADYSTSLVTRGVTLVMARRPSEALESLTTAHANYHALHGPQHGNTLTPQMYRAVAFAYLGRFADARTTLVSALDHDPAVPNFPWWEQHESGIVHRLSGDNAAAIASQEKALTLIKPGPRAQWEQVRVYPELALAQFAIDDRAAAASSVSEAMALFSKLRVAMHPAFAETLTLQGALQLDKDPRAALGLLERGEEYWRSTDAENHAGGESAYWLAVCHTRLGNHDAARTHMKRARKLLSASPLPRDRELLKQIRL